MVVKNWVENNLGLWSKNMLGELNPFCKSLVLSVKKEHQECLLKMEIFRFTFKNFDSVWGGDKNP